MALTDINRKNDSEQNSCCDATYFTEFVQSHRATMDYLSRFGSPVDKAKISILFEMAGVKV